ncbi:MAG: cytochrome c biogenesis protein ResB [Deltaproteobacteria bacterium]|jgi:cytochrome c biogenesis protein
MKKEKNSLWQFLASVRLALFTFFIIAAASIFGTVIPQNQPYEKYVQIYGPKVAELFRVLNFTDMYNSVWFLALLAVFSMNLIVCTIDRFPNIWRLVTMDNLDIDPSRVEKMSRRAILRTDKPAGEAAAEVKRVLADAGWKTEERSREGGTLLFAQKGAWTRLGVIGVHMSILIIFVGAIIGSIFGLKGSIMLPEGSATDQIYQFGQAHTSFPLGFTVRCDNFDISFYDSGMPKEYRSDLTVIKNGKDVYSKSIVVNDPMHYGGFTFYQASYQPTQQLLAKIQDLQTGKLAAFTVPLGQEIKWPEKGVDFGVINQEGPDFRGRYRFKIWFSDGKGSPSEFWVDLGQQTTIKRQDASYSFLLDERYATGLQVSKDPGVWEVYIGCTIMLLGLLVAFFMSHRRLWVDVASGNSRSRITLGGQSNKNKVGFDNIFADLEEKISQDPSLNASKERS